MWPSKVLTLYKLCHLHPDAKTPLVSLPLRLLLPLNCPPPANISSSVEMPGADLPHTVPPVPEESHHDIQRQDVVDALNVVYGMQVSTMKAEVAAAELRLSVLRKALRYRIAFADILYKY
jgi:hypothetical protein